MLAMTTWQDFAGNTGKATTTWQYDPQRGQLASKTYSPESIPSDPNSPPSGLHSPVSYKYTPAGRLQTRTWSRGLVTSYGYGQDGALGSVDYSDATPDIAYTYHRLGQVAEVRDGTLASGAIADTDLRYRHHYSLTPELRPDTETIDTGGTFTLQRHYESTAPAQVPGRYQGYTLSSVSETSSPSVSSVTQSVSYSYSPSTGRLQTITSDAGTFTYAYLPNAGLIETVTGPVHTVHNTYQPFGYGLKSKTNKVGATVVSKFEYRLNDLGQRTAMVTTGTAFAQSMQYQYRYNEKGEVIAGDRYQGADLLNPGPAIPADTFAYQFDDIGNRRTATRATDPETQNPDPETRNPKLETYTANLLNQYTQIATSVASSASVPSVAQSDSPVHDADGNLVSDARWHYTWNAENRLIEMETEPAAVAAGAPKQKLLFTYDYQGRRVSKNVYSWNLALETWHLERGTRFLYDGWNLLAEFSSSTSTPDLNRVRAYVWGIDLSGSIQGAGGVGGLLASFEISNAQISNAAYAAFDANGNVSEYLDASGAPAAHFEYSPFGQTIRSQLSNPQISDLPYRFSTKYTDAESDLLYYGLRYYDPSTGRWPSRDPIGEDGGMNLYGMVANSPICFSDHLGLYARDFHFYVIYYIARARCYSEHDAYRLAGFSQYVDQNPQTDAISIWKRLTSPLVYTGTDDVTISRMRTLTERNAFLHFPGSTAETGAVIEGGGTLERLRNSMVTLDFNSERSLAVAGAALHSYADTWGHQGYSAWPTSKVNARPGALGFIGGVASFFIGHGSGLSEPDTPYKNPTAAILAAKRIFEEIPDRCSNPCSDWTVAKKDLMQMFNLRENDVDQREKLMRKIINTRFKDHVLYNERDFYVNSSIYLNYLGLPDTYDWGN